MDFAGWVTIENNSGKKYEKAKVKLIAGDVNIVQQYNEFQSKVYIQNAAIPVAGAAVI